MHKQIKKYANKKFTDEFTTRMCVGGGGGYWIGLDLLQMLSLKPCWKCFSRCSLHNATGRWLISAHRREYCREVRLRRAATRKDDKDKQTHAPTCVKKWEIQFCWWNFAFTDLCGGKCFSEKFMAHKKTIILIPPEGDLTRHITFAVKEVSGSAI